MLDSPKDAIVGLLVGAMHADGQALRAEMQTATLHLEALEALDVTAFDVRNRADALGRLFDETGAEAFLARCAKALPADLHAPALAAVAAVVAADHAVTPAEVAYLRRAAVHLGLAPEDVERLVVRLA